MGYRLFLDDERFPAGDDPWVVVRSTAEAIATVTRLGMPDYIMFDHDLAGEDRAIDFVKWLTDYVLDNELAMDGFDYYVHSRNPIGRVDIASRIDGLMRHAKATFGRTAPGTP